MNVRIVEEIHQKACYGLPSASTSHRFATKFVERLGADLGHVYNAKYKPVAKRKLPVPVSVPVMIREPYKPLPIPDVPILPHHPPSYREFPYTSRLTEDRVDLLISNVEPGFLSDDELSLLMHVVSLNEAAFAFDDSERGTFKQEYFPDYIMETVPHVPWQQDPIKIPKALESEVTSLLRQQMESGNLEDSHSSYRSRVFVVQKPKGGLRVVHDLQPLNNVSIRDAMLPPNVHEFAEKFVGYSIYGTMDLYSGYHQRRLHVDSRPLTACTTPIGSMQLTSLPIGYTNSMQEFQRSTSHIIYNMGEDKSGAFVDDIGIKGPKTTYASETIPENPNIRRFVWEYAHTLHECLATFIIAGATAAGKKFVLATRVVNIVGYLCSLEGMKPNHGIVSKIQNWPRPRNVSEVRGLLGTIGVTRNWIKDYAKIAKPLTLLTRVDREFEWNEEAEAAMIMLKKKVTEIVALRSLNMAMAKKASLDVDSAHPGEGQVIVAVDSSHIAVGYVLYQVLWDDEPDIAPKFEDKKMAASDEKQRTRKLKRFPIMFGSITWNDVESRYSQPKIELYGLFRALKALRFFVWGLRIIVEVDASFLPKTAHSPELPNAASTRWISYIQLFDVVFKHVPAESHKAADGLSRRTKADQDSDDTEIDEEIDGGGPYLTGSPPIRAPLQFPLLTSPNDNRVVALSSLSSLNSRRHHHTSMSRRMKDWHTAYGSRKVEPHSSTSKSPSERAPPSVRRSQRLLQKSGPVGERGVSNPSEASPDDGVPPTEASESDERTIDGSVGDDEESTSSEGESQMDEWESLRHYLTTGLVPVQYRGRPNIPNRAKQYFVYDRLLWKRGSPGPRRVIENDEHRRLLIRQAHNESGHRGRDPTYKKLCDFYYWPNMYNDVAVACRTCRECQLRSTYRPVVRIQPTWVPTIFRKFNMDLVDMGIPSKGFKYIVDIRDDLSGWLEARMLSKKNAEDVAQFLWQDVICRYGCVPQITTDNGSEFQGAAKILADRYGIRIVRSSKYHPEGNGMIERGHRSWIESIWKLCKRFKNGWSNWFYAAMWADRVTVKRTTGFSPYHLLYGIPHVFPFMLNHDTWYTQPWHNITSTEELLEVRALQLQNLQDERNLAVASVIRSRKAAADAYAEKNKLRLVSGEYRRGEFVLVAIKGKGIKKGVGRIKSADRWAGPFKINARYRSGSYELRELDGTIIAGAVPASHLRAFYTTKHQVQDEELLPDYSDDEHEGEWEWSAEESSDDAEDSDFVNE